MKLLLLFQLLWLNNEPALPDTHTAFRGHFKVERASTVQLNISGASWYVVWIDGNYFYEGPDRYHPKFPEYQVKDLKIAAGEHVIAVQVHYEGVDTRMLKSIQPFLYCRLEQNEIEIPIDWHCARLNGYQKKIRRINDQLGWVEWLDTRMLPEHWQSLFFDDSLWEVPVEVRRDIGSLTASKIGNVKSKVVDLKPIAHGPLAETYGYEQDNISARFFLRDLECKDVPPQGVWRRYDLGAVWLSRPVFQLDVPPGTVIEFAYSETLVHGRVSPWITLSASDSYNIDHFIAKGGLQEFFPLAPKGGRFMEVHVFAKEADITWRFEQSMIRCYYDKVEGSFTTADTLLNKIWKTGIDTYLSCSEDALIDNPTRERGQWLGDVGIVGMQIGRVGFSDIRSCRRGLIQAAQSAREDGMVAGLCPGGEAYLSSYAAQWVPAVLEYFRLTGDKSLLEETYPAAKKNFDAFMKYMSAEGISNEAGWAFIDWGYVPNGGTTDMGLNLHCFIMFRELSRWATLLGKNDDSKIYSAAADQLKKILNAYFYSGLTWKQIGYHRMVLGIMGGFIKKEDLSAAVTYIKGHIEHSFPNDSLAPRLSGPNANNPQLITPYFAHYALPVLIANGEVDFVLNHYRICWGWMLSDGDKTWKEVFDPRWSHSHQWAGCPTWQLSRYFLGLNPRFDVGANVFDLDLVTGSLDHAEGDVPLDGEKKIHVSWKRNGPKIDYTISSPVDIRVRKADKTIQLSCARCKLVELKD